jgi:1-phosphofructokinase family hexose kinase
MIYTLTLNPALDLELTVAEFRYNQVLRASQVRVDSGGKGFNISRALAQWGAPNLALGLVGGKTGERLVEELNRLGVQTDFTWIEGETRTNIGIVTNPPGDYLKVNQPGPTATPGEMERLMRKIESRVTNGDVWVLSGSLLPGSTADTYAQIIRCVQSAGGLALVDADGETLLQACEAKPYLVKPNALEASQVTGIEISFPQDCPSAAGYFHSLGVPLVLVTLAEQGAVLTEGSRAWWARPPRLTIHSPIGAGDAALAGFVYGLSHGENLAEALRLSVASGTASASLPGTAVAEWELVQAVARDVVISEL